MPPLSFGLPPLSFGLPPLSFGLPPLSFGLPPLTTVESAEAPVVSITLAGVGTELGPAERPRTAILSAEGRVVLGRVGDEIAGRYQVRAVASDTVELLDLQSGAILHLTLP